MRPKQKADWKWQQRRAGESFFVPTLRPYELRHEGLLSAKKFYGSKCRVKAAVGIHSGLLGVMFTVPVLREKARPHTSDQSEPVAHPTDPA